MKEKIIAPARACARHIPMICEQRNGRYGIGSQGGGSRTDTCGAAGAFGRSFPPDAGGLRTALAAIAARSCRAPNGRMMH